MVNYLARLFFYRSRSLGRGCDEALFSEQKSYAKSSPERVPGDNLFLCREGCGEVFGSCGGDKF